MRRAVAEHLTPAERRLSVVLRVLAALLAAAAPAYLLAALIGPWREFVAEPPFVANSAVKVAILAIICLYAGGDVRRRRDLVPIVVAAHVISLLAMASMLVLADTARTADLGFAEPSVGTVLWIAMALDGLIALVLLALYLPVRGCPGPEPRTRSEMSTAAERRTKAFLAVFAVLFALGAVAYGLGPLLDTSEELFRELPFVTNSVVKVATLAMLCAYAARDVGRNLELVAPIVAVHVVSVLGQALLLVFLDTGYARPLLGGSVEMTGVLWGAIALDGAIAVLFALVGRAAWQARFGLRYFGPLEIRGLVGVSDVLVVGEQEIVPPEAIARRVDAAIADIRARRRILYRIVLLAVQARPLLDVLPPLSEVEPIARRAYLWNRFHDPPPWPPFLANLTRIQLRVCQQLSYVGYYGDPAAYPSIGYEPFTQRSRYPGLGVVDPGPHPLKVQRPEEIGAKRLEADICIVGSGAAGGILAHELAELDPDASILVLERGAYLEPRHFREDEVWQIGRLYADGLMQQTSDFRFTVLQGSCVGGSTTVNNAVCFDPPPAVLALWNDAAHDAGLDLTDLAASVAAVRTLLDVHEQAEAHLNPSGERYLRGATELPLTTGIVQANIRDCFGSGYCNIGCKWGRKLSMLDTALPWAQRRHGDRVRIVSDCEVERIITVSGSPKRVSGLRAKLADGRAVHVKAGRYVIAAGAVASSHLLLRSGIDGGLPVGRRFSCNMGAPLHAELPDRVRSYDGLQISHFGIPQQAGFVFETWFNPPVSQALNMPGWFERHFENMRRYDRLMAVGVLVGTESNGRIKRGLLGPDIDFTPTGGDRATLARGLKLLARLLFDAGATRVMLNTWGDDELLPGDDIDAKIDEVVADPGHITLGTGHPQGGNAMSRDPGKGVVGPDFRVHGYEDLHVCDASVFPTSLTVNPQLTVMALAHLAARRMSGLRRT